MRKILVGYILALCLLFSGIAAAEWSAPDANLEAYTKQYAEEAEAYKRIAYGAEGETVGQLKQTLADLGYFPYRMSNNYYRTMEIAVHAFAQQMRIDGDGSELTPLMQAMLADTASMPKAISPAVNVYDHSWEPDGRSYTPYTYTRLTRKSVVSTPTKVGFSGEITAASQSAGTYYYCVQMEDDPEKVVYVTYKPLPRTTVFQSGDLVTVFGSSQGERAYSYPAMETTALSIQATQIGYTPG